MVATRYVLLAALCLTGCTRTPSTDTGAASSRAVAPGTGTIEVKSAAPVLDDAGAKAELGKPAPAFTLPDESGKPVSLASYKGKRIVLEWFNPDCPFVKASHTKGSLVKAAAEHQAKGVVWLAINSGAPGKQGHGAQRNAESKKQWSLAHPILIDESGAVGKAYGAQRTPHMFVIDENGILVYAGAIDNSPDGEGESPSGDKLVSYVDAALADLGSNRPVVTPKTEPYGCSVKYAD